MYQIIKFPINLGCDKAGVERGACVLQTLIEGKVAVAKEVKTISCPHVWDFEDTLEQDNMMYVKPIMECSEELTRSVCTSLQQGFTPLILGGDHSLAWGSISGVVTYDPDVAVVYIDAHGDINTAASTMSKHVHGIHMSFLMNLGEQEYNCKFTRHPLLAKNLLFVGTRSLDPEEHAIIGREKIQMLSSKNINAHPIDITLAEISKFIKSHKNIHISLDIDVLDPLVAPGTGVPEKDGINVGQLKAILKILFDSKQVISMDIVEFNPLLDKADKTHKAIDDLLSVLPYKTT